MRSAAAAFAWEFRQRHRWGLLALIVYLVVIAAIKLMFVTHGLPIRFDSPESFAFVDVVPLTATFTYFLAVFTFGLDGDLAARQSMYPPRMFTRPVTTAALVGWPMLYGSAAMILLWLATRLFALWPGELGIPTIWPALLAASLLAWTQALTWMPYPLPGLRIVVSVLVLWSLDAVVFLWLYRKPPESAMLAIIVPQLPLAYLVACIAVARARRGDVPDWRGAFAWLAPIARLLSSPRRHFHSPASAQAWFERRRIGRSLPGWVAILLPFELALLLVSNNVPVLVFEILFGVLLTPPLMATFTAANVRKSSPHARDSYAVTPFDATRPLTSAGLVAAKLRATIWSTALAWLLVLVAIPIALMLTGTAPVVTELARGVAEDVGTPRAIVLVLLLFSLLITSTWKQLVQSLYIGLTGREWLIKGSVFVILLLLFSIGPIVQWISEHKAVQGALWDALPLILASLACVKMCAAAWVATRLHSTRLVSDRALVTGAASWCVVVLALYAVFAWFMETPFFPRYVLALIAILAIPLARLSAAPLALAWNRHR